MAVSDSNRRLARIVAGAFGRAPRVPRYWDEDKTHHVDIAQLSDSPEVGLTSYSTLGLSDWPLMDGGTEYPVRAELVGGCATRYDLFPNMLSTAAFNIMKDRWFAYPGRIFPDITAMYYPTSAMHHIMFVEPFLWEDSFDVQELPDKTVAWLLVIPISDGEMQYARQNDPDALEDLLEEKEVDIFDLERESVV